MVPVLRWSLTVLFMCACATRVPWGRAHETSPARDARRIDVAITSEGFRPQRIHGRAGEAITLVFTRMVERSCVDRVILSLDEDRRIERDLPLRVPVTVPLVLEAVGELGFSCPMGMHGGTIEVR
jgi:plastocyanin domain-containing protein